MNPTWSLVARPVPTTAFLTSAGGYSATSRCVERGGEEDGAARVAEDDRAAGVLSEEDALDRDDVGGVALQELRHALVDVAQALGQRGARLVVRMTPHSSSDTAPSSARVTTP